MGYLLGKMTDFALIIKNYINIASIDTVSCADCFKVSIIMTGSIIGDILKIGMGQEFRSA